MKGISVNKERLDALLELLDGDTELVEELLTSAVGQKSAGSLGMRLKQAQPPSPLDAALDRLRAALEQARQQQGDQELVKLVDSFASLLKPKAAGGPKALGDSEKPEAERTKEAGFYNVLDDFLFGGGRNR